MPHHELLHFWYTMRDIYIQKNKQNIVLKIDDLIDRIISYLYQKNILVDCHIEYN